MARVPKVTTGTYDGKRFELLDCFVHIEGPEYIEGSEYIRRVEGYLIAFYDGSEKYVLDYDPLLKFDPIRLED